MRRRKQMRRTRISRVNKERKARLYFKQFHSELRVRVVKTMPCAVPDCRDRRIDNHHIVSRNRGGTYFDVIPLCQNHHRATGFATSWHNLGSRERFEQAHGIDCRRVADWTETRCIKLGVYEDDDATA